MTETSYPVYGEITGPIVMIGFGSIGRGTLPLIERHFKFDKSRMVVIDPRNDDAELLAKHGVKHIQAHVTKENYKELLKPLLKAGKGQGFCVNLSVDTGSLDLMKMCRKLDVLYIDTVVEPWLGFYFDKNMKNSERTNYALRETVRAEIKKTRAGPPPFPPAAQTRAWFPGSSSRRWSTSPTNSASSSKSRRRMTAKAGPS